ncbi:MAG: hypothetical protein ACI81R_000011 [Bradymonadia bacterium]|jgi:hypothetical protein
MKRTLLIAATLATCLFTAPPHAAAQYLTGDRSAAIAGGADPDFWDYQDAPRTHDRGLLLRASFGPSFITTRSYVDQDTRLILSGGALAGQLTVGGIVAPDVAVHLSGSIQLALSPAVYIGGEALEAESAGLKVWGIAPGLTLYLPNDVFFSPSFGVAILAVRFDEQELGQPDPLLGFYVDISAGKEWWIADKFSTGVAAQLTVHNAPSNLSAPFGGLSFGVNWTSTFN